MSNTLTLKRSATQGKVPTTTQLALGELAINTYDGTLFLKSNKSGTEAIVQVGAVTSVAGRTGAVTLSTTDISGLGTAATLNVGTAANDVVQLDSTGKLPAVDGSQLTNLASSNTWTVENGSDGKPGFIVGTDVAVGATSLTLKGSYGTAANVIVFFDAAFQPDVTLAGTTLGFPSGIPAGVQRVYVRGGSSVNFAASGGSRVLQFYTHALVSKQISTATGSLSFVKHGGTTANIPLN